MAEYAQQIAEKEKQIDVWSYGRNKMLLFNVQQTTRNRFRNVGVMNGTKTPGRALAPPGRGREEKTGGSATARNFLRKKQKIKVMKGTFFKNRSYERNIFKKSKL